MGLGKSLKKIAKHTVAPVFSLPAKAIEKATGMDWKAQLATGASIGAGLYGARGFMGATAAKGIPGLQGGVPLSGGQVPMDAVGSAGGGFKFGSVMPGVLGLAGDVYSARVAAGGVEDANAASLASAREQMAFQERMSSTAHQREVADLEAAGLNPVLSANAGAQGASGAAVNFGNEAPDYTGAMRNAVSSAMESQRLAMELARLKVEMAEAGSRVNVNEANADAIRAGIPVRQFESFKAGFWHKFWQSLKGNYDKFSAKVQADYKRDPMSTAGPGDKFLKWLESVGGR